LIRGLARRCNQIIDIDFKGGGNLSHLPALMRLNNLEIAPETFWSHLNVLLDEREAGYAKEFPPLHVFVDELAATLISSSGAAKTIERIATRGRSASVFLVAANQSTSGVSRTIILNCQHRVLLGMVDPIDRTQLGAKSTQPTRPPTNDLLVGEYLHIGRQAEFLFEKPTTSADALPPPINRLDNPLVP
jgi:DNA segregation ATPase FtsK/SpoIIIE-like protein